MQLTDSQQAQANNILDTKMDLMMTEGCSEEEKSQYQRDARLVAEILAIFVDQTPDQIAIAALKRWRKRVTVTPAEKVSA